MVHNNLNPLFLPLLPSPSSPSSPPPSVQATAHYVKLLELENAQLSERSLQLERKVRTLARDESLHRSSYEDLRNKNQTITIELNRCSEQLQFASIQREKETNQREPILKESSQMRERLNILEQERKDIAIAFKTQYDLNKALEKKEDETKRKILEMIMKCEQYEIKVTNLNNENHHLKVLNNETIIQREDLTKSQNTNHVLMSKLENQGRFIQGINMDNLLLTSDIVEKEEKSSELEKMINEQKTRHLLNNEEWRQKRILWNQEKDVLLMKNEKDNEMKLKNDEMWKKQKEELLNEMNNVMKENGSFKRINNDLTQNNQKLTSNNQNLQTENEEFKRENDLLNENFHNLSYTFKQEKVLYADDQIKFNLEIKNSNQTILHLQNQLTKEKQRVIHIEESAFQAKASQMMLEEEYVRLKGLVQPQTETMEDLAEELRRALERERNCQKELSLWKMKVEGGVGRAKMSDVMYSSSSSSSSSGGVPKVHVSRRGSVTIGQ